MFAELPTFRYNTIAKPRMCLPKQKQRFAQRCCRAFDANLRISFRESPQRAGYVEKDAHSTAGFAANSSREHDFFG